MLSKMAIGKRLLFGFSVLIVFSVILGAVAIYAMGILVDLTDKMHNHPMVVSNAVRDIKINIVSIHRSMKDVVLAENESQLESAILLVNEHEHEINQLFEIINKRFLGHQKDVIKARKSFKAWKPIRDEVITLIKKGKIQEAANITKGKGARHVESMHNDIHIMADFAFNKATEFKSGAYQTRNYVISGIIFLFVVIVLSGLIVSRIIIKSITIPLSKLSQATTELAAGNLAARCQIENKDEFATFAGLFNQMATEIQQSHTTLELKVKERTEKLNTVISDLKSVIEERTKAEKALVESESRLRYLFESNTAGVLYWKKDGAITDANSTFLDMIGYSREELEKGLIDWRSITPPEYEEQDKMVFREIVTTGVCLPFEKEYIKKDGSRLSIIMNAASFEGDPDSGVSFVVDTTTLKQTEQALNESREKYHTYIESAPIGIFVSNDDNLIDVNKAACLMTGFSEKELRGKNIHQILPDEVVAKYKPEALNPREQQHIEVDTELKCNNGNIMHIAYNAVNLSDGSLMAFCTDISKRKIAEAEKNMLEHQLRQSQKMEAVGRLAGGIAHDFNNLLTGITGNIQLAQMDVEDNDELAETLDDINTAAERASQLVKQLLAFSRKQLISLKVLNLNNLILNMEQMLSRLIGEHIELITKLDANLAAVKADHVQIEQIVMNLVVNAKDAMPSGGVLTIETVEAVPDDEFCKRNQLIKGKYVVLNISDDGMGMDEKTLKHIFDPFYTTKSVDKGTGLGLSTVYGIVKQHKGHIEVSSTPENGTIFSTYLLSTDEESKITEEEKFTDELPRGDETILVVEDERMVREIATRILKRQGYTVLEAATGEEAIEVLENTLKKIDFLMTDVIMPGMNGRELADYIAKKNPETKILFTSGYTENVFESQNILEDKMEFIAKPYTPRSLAFKVREIFDKKH